MMTVEEKEILQRGKEALAKMGIGTRAVLTEQEFIERAPIELELSEVFQAPKPAKKPRSDKGKPRPPKPEPAKAGVLTEEQVNKLRILADQKVLVLEANTKAEAQMIEACERFDAYLDELSGK